MSRILTITSWYPPHHYGGYELSCFDVMKRFVERDHDVRVLCGDERLPGALPPEPDHERLVYRELRPHMWEGSRRRPSLRERMAIERHNHHTLERHLQEYAPDVVSVWHMVAVSLGMVRQLIERRTPLVYAVCDNWPVYGEEVDAWMSLFSGGIVRSLTGRAVERITRVPTRLGDIGESGAFCFVSDWTRRRAVATEPWSYPLSTVVYSGIERTYFPRLSSPPDREWRWRLLYVGRFDAWKGVDTLLRALPLLPPETTLSLYGRGGVEQRNRLGALADTLGISDRVSFGALEREELAPCYAAADVVVFPSEWDEPFGLVPIEAMASGTPVVATAMGGSAEFLRDGYNCVQFPARDAAELASAVCRLAADHRLRERVVVGGFRTAEQLDVDTLADAFEQWHVAATEQFVHGQPPDRQLDLPPRSEPEPAPDDPGAREAFARLAAEVLGTTRGRVRAAASGPDGRLAVVVARRSDGSIVAMHPDHLAAGPTTRTASGGHPSMTVVAAGEKLPFRSRAFDALACHQVLEDASGDEACAREFARVLRPGGRALLAVANRGDLLVARTRARDRLHLVDRPPQAYFHDHRHAREYTWSELERLVRPVFRLRRRHVICWGRGPKSRVATRLVQFGPLRVFSRGIGLEVEPRSG